MTRSGTVSSWGNLAFPALLGIALPYSTVFAGDAPADELATVFVTADRTKESVQNVPLSISAIDGDTASKLGITDTQSLAGAVPGVLFNRQANTAIPFIRGVGSPVGEAGDEPSVAFYVDDVYQPAAAASLANFNSVERIEVDKGPQGTLFGRNATGGVVQVYTRDPTPAAGLDLSVGASNYDTQSASLYATSALNDRLSANVALSGAQGRHGWGRDDTTGESLYTGWSYNGRAKLAWTLPSIRALLTVDHDDTRTQEGVVLRAFPGTGSLNPTPSPTRGLAAPQGFYDGNDVPAQHSITYQSGASLKVVGDIGAIGITSITAWRQTNAVEGIDEDPGVDLTDTQVTTAERTWTEELRVASAAISRTAWIAGLFYYRDVAGYDPLSLSGSAVPVLLTPIQLFGVQRTDSWAGFAQIRRAILPRTEVTLGVRYTTDRRNLVASGTAGAGPNTEAPNSPQRASWSKPTYRAALDYHLTDDVMEYAAFNRGFKSGLFNPLVSPGKSIDPPVAPETLDAYTLGAKSELLEHRLRINLEAYYYRYRNVQVQEIISGATHISNAAGARIRGLDLDASLIPVTGLTVSASMEIQNGRYTSYPNGLFYVYQPQSGGNCLFAGPGSCGGSTLPPHYSPATGDWDLRGDHTIQTPSFSSTLRVEEVIPSPVGDWALAASWAHIDRYFADVDNGRGQIAGSSPKNDEQPVLDLLEASLQWSPQSMRWQVRAWGKNLIGRRYWSFAQENEFVTQYSAAAPLTFGVTVTRRW